MLTARSMNRVNMGRGNTRVDERINPGKPSTAVALHSPEGIHERNARDEDEGRNLHGFDEFKRICDRLDWLIL